MRHWLLLFLTLLISKPAWAEVGLATYYTEASCKREGTSGVWTASGARFDENALTCARRSREWGSRWRVTNLENGKSIIVTQNDFGPGKRPYKRGVRIDLTKAAWLAIGLQPLGARHGRGEVKVLVERV